METKIEECGENTVIEYETLTDGSVAHNVVFRDNPKAKAPRLNLRFGCTSEKAAMELAAHLEAAAWFEAL